MTPQWATQILETANHDNRPIRRGAVKRLAESIKEGMWQITHQGIAIDTNGKLQDGQHRLSAIVEANQPVEILLTTGTYPASYGVLDCGVGRTAADSLERIGTCKNSARAAAGIKVYYLYKRHPKKSGAIQTHLRKLQLFSFTKKTKLLQTGQRSTAHHLRQPTDF